MQHPQRPLPRGQERLRVEGATRDETAAYLSRKGIEIEESFDSITGALGDGPALYVRDPDGYRIELKFYGEA